MSLQLFNLVLEYGGKIEVLDKTDYIEIHWASSLVASPRHHVVAQITRQAIKIEGDRGLDDFITVFCFKVRRYIKEYSVRTNT